MTRGSDAAPSRLVLRFLAGSLAVFLAVGAGVAVLTVRAFRARAESTASFHARFAADSVLGPALDDVDLSVPLTGEAYERLDALVRERILSAGRAVRVKIWRPDGTVVYSDFRPAVGRRFPEEARELREVMAGSIENGISDLDPRENFGERGLADKLFQTYVPLRTARGNPPVAVAELYQRYSVIQADIDRMVRAVALAFGVGLLLLYAALLPIALNASRALRERNRLLREQAGQLEELLEREQRTVAELRELDQRKNDFVAAASHELRTPLTSIVGYLRTLQEHGLQADETTRAEFLTAAEQQANRLMRLIGNLLNAGHLERGTRPIEMGPFAVGEVVDEVLAELPSGAHRVHRRFPPELGPVITDRGRIRDVLLNLVDNALKCSPEDTGVEVGASSTGRVLELWVTDRGVGIHPSEHERIFERFHQIDQSATRRFGGVGLGLHLAKELTEELGGRILVRSAPGEGSTFTVVVPSGVPPGARETSSVHGDGRSPIPG